jgi:hypothetical protein
LIKIISYREGFGGNWVYLWWLRKYNNYMQKFIKKSPFLLTILLLSSNICFGQKEVEYIARAVYENNLKILTLQDSVTKTKFILDSAQITITAIDTNGKQLWQTDPWKDNKLKVYRIDRPIIVHFNLGKAGWNSSDPKKEVIWIGYNNTQFGTLDKLTGKFIFLGQD